MGDEDLQFRALQPIAKDEELTWFYGEEFEADLLEELEGLLGQQTDEPAGGDEFDSWEASSLELDDESELDSVSDDAIKVTCTVTSDSGGASSALASTIWTTPSRVPAKRDRLKMDGPRVPWGGTRGLKSAVAVPPGNQPMAPLRESFFTRGHPRGGPL